jgi:hypothetical protein
MHRASPGGSALTLVLLLGASGVARAATPTDDLPRLDERTALMIGANRLKVGVLSFDYGLVERVSIGTDPPAWAARAFYPVLIPNAHVKVSLFQRGPVAVTGQGAGYYLVLRQNGSATGSLVSVPVSLFASVRFQPRVWLHGEGAYVFVCGFGSGDLNASGINGQVAAQAAQGAAMLEWRVTRIFSLTALGRYQFWTGPLAFEGTGTLDPYTSVNVDGTAKPRVEHPWMAIGGVALLWRHFHLIAGAGYGYYFVPGIDIAYPNKGFVPDLSASFVL